jgi:uncharacterized protein (TIGR00730 family)
MPAARRASVFGSARTEPGSSAYEDVRRQGRLLAEAGYTVCTGGYLGAMAAASQGAREAGGQVIGVTVAPWADARTPNRWLTEEIATTTLHERLQRLLESDALLGVDGGVGTLAEVALGWNLRQKGATRAPLILIGPHWRRVMAALAEALRIPPADLALLTLVDTPVDAVALLRGPLTR